MSAGTLEKRFRTRDLVVIASALGCSVVLAWLAYKNGETSVKRYQMTAAEQSAFLNGSMFGALIPPAVVAGISCAFRGRSLRRAILVYTVAAAFSIFISVARLMMSK